METAVQSVAGLMRPGTAALLAPLGFSESLRERGHSCPPPAGESSGVGFA